MAADTAAGWRTTRLHFDQFAEPAARRPVHTARGVDANLPEGSPDYFTDCRAFESLGTNVNVIARPKSRVDKRQPNGLSRSMSSWVRILTICLSLALLGGSVVHGITGTRMALQMAAATSVDVSTEASCPACIDDTDEQTIVCSFDCTAPVFTQLSAPATLTLIADLMRPVPSIENPLHGHSVDFEPSPPRPLS